MICHINSKVLSQEILSNDSIQALEEEIILKNMKDVVFICNDNEIVFKLIHNIFYIHLLL